MARTVFRNANLFDSTSGTLKPGTTIVVEDGRIDAVSQGSLAVDDAEQIDVDGRVVLPGLIDAHVHVTATIPDFFKLSMLPQSLVTAQSSDILESMLMRGYTTVRDAGGADWVWSPRSSKGISPDRACSSRDARSRKRAGTAIRARRSSPA